MSFRPRIWQKLGLLCCSFTLPVVLTTVLLYNEQSIKIDFAAQELVGVQYLRALSRLLPDVWYYRTLAGAAQTLSTPAQLREQASLIDGDLRGLASDSRRYGARLAVTPGRVPDGALPATLIREWRAAGRHGQSRPAGARPADPGNQETDLVRWRQLETDPRSRH